MGLRFTDEEEQEFQSLTRLTPKGFGQHLGVWADRIANTVGMFLVLLLFSLLAETVFRPILNQMLFISNTYQLIALPILGIATGLSTTIILRFLFRILLEIRREFRATQNLLQIVQEEQAETKQMHQEIHFAVTQMHSPDPKQLAEAVSREIAKGLKLKGRGW